MRKDTISGRIHLVWMLAMVILAMFALCCHAAAQEASPKLGISILGDSISTYDGVSNNTAYNSTIGNGLFHYSPGVYGMYQSDTWWQQALDVLDAELVVNNSWGRSKVLDYYDIPVAAAHGVRSVNLHNNDGRNPDVIAIFMGTNDYLYKYKHNLGSLGTASAINYSRLIVDNGDGTFSYATPVTTCEAYAVMLHKIRNRYPLAEIYCMTLFPYRNPDYQTGSTYVVQTTALNQDIAAIAKRFGCTVVDLENCGVTKDPENFDPYFGDYFVHPNKYGMDLITEAFLSAVLRQDIQLYDIEFEGASAQQQEIMPKVALAGSPYTLTIPGGIDEDEYSVRVIMGGEDISKSCYSKGVISIPAVTADVQIAFVEKPHNYLWKFSGDDLANVEGKGNTRNALEKLAGSHAGGVLASVRYQLERPVKLLHDRDWAFEWKGTGAGGAAFSENSSITLNSLYFIRGEANQLFAFGAYNGSQFNNYGILLPSGIDLSAEHVFRLENHVYSNGNNMIYLCVDGVEVGALTTYFINYADQGTKSSWIGGRDVILNYLGAESSPLNGMSIEYLQVWEDNAPEKYCEHEEIIDVGVEPTCTQTGLTSGSHCALCNLVLVPQKELEALGHTEEILPALEPTCTQTGLTEGLRCTVCEEMLTPQEELEALGHTEEVDAAVEATCTQTGLTEGAHCSVCGEILTAQEIIPATGHELAFEQSVYEMQEGGKQAEVRLKMLCGHDVSLELSIEGEIQAEAVEPLFWRVGGESCCAARLTVQTLDDFKTTASCSVIVHSSQRLKLPKQLTHISEEAFVGLPVREIVLGEGVEHIAARAFADCRDLVLIRLPEGVTIEADAFSGCDRMSIICSEGSTAHAYAEENAIPYILF